MVDWCRVSTNIPTFILNFCLDDDEVEDVKNLIIATLILVGITLILVSVTIIYVLRKVSE